MGDVFEATDIELAEHVLKDVYGNMRITARGERHAMRLAQTSLTPAVRFDHVSFAMGFDRRGHRGRARRHRSRAASSAR